MTKFEYIAKDENGKKYKGRFEARDESELHLWLRKMDLYPVEVRVSGGETFTFMKPGIKTEEIVVFSERLSVMINAGLPIVRCLRTIGKQTENPELKKVIYRMCVDIEGGLGLSEAMQKHSKVFSDYYINLMKAGESGGILDEVLERLAEYLNKEQELKRKIKQAFSYPVIVLLVSMVVVGFLVMFIVPVFADMYRKMGRSLPVPTVVLVNISKFTGAYWWAVLAGLAAAYAGFIRLYAMEKGRYFIDNIKLKLPIFGMLNRKIAISRFIRTFGSLFSSGVAVTKALGVVRKITGNSVVSGIIDKLQTDVREGKNISDQLSRESVFPPMVVQMIASGEEAGVLDIMLKKSADFLDKDIDFSVDRIVGKLEPVLTIILAVIVGFIALAIYLPMFDLMTGIG